MHLFEGYRFGAGALLLMVARLVAKTSCLLRAFHASRKPMGNVGIILRRGQHLFVYNLTRQTLSFSLLFLSFLLLLSFTILG